MALKNPILSNPIAVDIPKLNEILDALSKANPTDVDGISTGAMRLIEVSSGKWQWQEYNGSSWAPVPFLQHNVDQLDGYHAAITPAANTVAVRNASGVLEDSITGNAATASSAATLSQTLPVNKGGTGATTSEAARANLGVPPTSHASTNTTHGVGNATQYGHLKLSDATNSSSGVTGGVAATPAAVKAAKDAADNAQSAADTAQSTAEAAMGKASTIATASDPGIAYFPAPFSVAADGKVAIRNASTTQTGVVQLSSATNSTSTTLAATASAVKAAYDKGDAAATAASKAQSAAEEALSAATTDLELKASRSSAGQFTVPNCKVGHPLYIMFEASSGNAPNSGTIYVECVSGTHINGRKVQLGDYKSVDSGRIYSVFSGVIIPSGTNVVFNIANWTSIANWVLRIYQ